MINHARTLLLNVPAGDVTCVWEEYIDSDFKPLILPTYLNMARESIFGPAPTRDALNIRTWQLLTLLHSGDATKYILELDPRITYIPQVKIKVISDTFVNNLPHLNCLSTISESVLQKLFNALIDFEAMWHSPLFTDKLSAIVLALIYKTEDIRSEVAKQ